MTRHWFELLIGEKLKSQDSLTEILDTLLDEDVTITFREVARRHPKLTSASSITRDRFRRALVDRYIERQQERRAWRDRTGKRSKANLARDLESRDRKIADLEAEIATLRASHVAMLRVVGEMGGFKRWCEFFNDYQDALQQLQNSAAGSSSIPVSNIFSIPPKTLG